MPWTDTSTPRLSSRNGSKFDDQDKSDVRVFGGNRWVNNQVDVALSHRDIVSTCIIELCSVILLSPRQVRPTRPTTESRKISTWSTWL